MKNSFRKIDVVILCGGKGTRMGDLVKDVPKPLIKIGDKTLLQMKLEALPQNVERVFIVVSHMKEKIIEHVEALKYPKPIVFVDQKETLGTAHALWQVKDQVGEHFISMMGDDLYSTKDIEFLSGLEWGLSTLPKPPKIGELSFEKEGDYFTSALTVDEKFSLEVVNYDCGMYKLKRDIFNQEMVPIKQGKEFGLPHTIIKFVEDTKTPLYLHRLGMWEIINSPEDLDRVKNTRL
ncbi:MAG: sugar phosphate nucleotidyltransferase [bacterium]